MAKLRWTYPVTQFFLARVLMTFSILSEISGAVMSWVKNSRNSPSGDMRYMTMEWSTAHAERGGGMCEEAESIYGSRAPLPRPPPITPLTEVVVLPLRVVDLLEVDAELLRHLGDLGGGAREANHARVEVAHVRANLRAPVAVRVEGDEDGRDDRPAVVGGHGVLGEALLCEGEEGRREEGRWE